MGDDYAQALIEGDPEVDIEQIGRAIATTDIVYLSNDGQILYAPPNWIEILTGPDGQEQKRRSVEDTDANVNDQLPVRWTGKKVARAQAIVRFVFNRTLQIRHNDGLSYDFAYAMAKQLDEANEMVLLGAGPKGNEPLIFMTNGTPYRGFLEGRVSGDSYKLLLHLSNMELKAPQ